MKRLMCILQTLVVSGLLYTVCIDPVTAQNTTCSTRPLGDNSNACASTSFVQIAINSFCTLTPNLCTTIFGYANVVWYGADPTAVADSTTPIQTAINFFTGGGEVYFPQGTFKTSNQLSITVQGISLVGSGRISSIIRTTSATASIISITANYPRIESLGLVGTTGQVQTSGNAISATGSQGGRYVNLFISDVFGAISLNNATSSLIQQIQVLNIYGPTGIASSNGGGDVIINNFLDPAFYGPYTAASGFGAWAQSTSYSLNQVRSANGGFFVCVQAGTSSSTGAGPVISPFGTQITDGGAKWLFITATNSAALSLTSTSNSNFISNNDMSGPWATGIFITSSSGNLIVSNTFGQIIGNGVQLNLNATDTLIQGNVISGMFGPTASAVQDATAGTATDTRVFNNFINGTGWHSILVQSVHWNVQGNFIQGQGTQTGGFGVSVGAGIGKFVISGNDIVPISSGTIQVATGASDFYSIIGNVVSGTAVVDGGSGTHKTVMGNN